MKWGNQTSLPSIGRFRLIPNRNRDTEDPESDRVKVRKKPLHRNLCDWPICK